MSESKHEKLRDLEEEIESLRKQPIFSKKEKQRLMKAERQISRAATDAEQEEVDKEEDPIKLYSDQRVAELDGQELGLTLTEFELLKYLKRHAPKTFTRQQLVEKIWSDSMMATERTVDAHIRNLRDKLGRYQTKIETVRGIGYRYVEEAEPEETIFQ